MSFSLKSIEDMGCIGMQAHGSAFYREEHFSTMWCQPGEVIRYNECGDIVFHYVHRHIHISTKTGSQSGLDSFIALNPTKLKISTKLKPPQLNPF